MSRHEVQSIVQSREFKCTVVTTRVLTPTPFAGRGEDLLILGLMAFSLGKLTERPDFICFWGERGPN